MNYSIEATEKRTDHKNLQNNVQKIVKNIMSTRKFITLKVDTFKYFKYYLS